MKRLVLHLAIIAVLFAVIGQGTAVPEEYIENGDFETGDLTGWSTDEGVVNDGTIEGLLLCRGLDLQFLGHGMPGSPLLQHSILPI